MPSSKILPIIQVLKPKPAILAVGSWSAYEGAINWLASIFPNEGTKIRSGIGRKLDENEIASYLLTNYQAMCGRYTLTTLPQEAIVISPEGEEVSYDPRYNIAPTNYCPVLPQDDPDHYHLYRWGLIPHWAKDEKIGYRMINARAETVAQKPSFREGVKKHRCLVPADGFYEWKKTGHDKQPYRIVVGDGKIFHFAGITAHWKHPDGHWIDTYTIITTTPNPMMKEIHDRMPVILGPAEGSAWLDPDHPIEELLPLLKPYPAEKMRAYPVSKAVGNVRNDGPELIEELTGID